MNHRRTLTATVMIAACVALAACSSGADNSQNGPISEPTEAAAVGSEPVETATVAPLPTATFVTPTCRVDLGDRLRTDIQPSGNRALTEAAPGLRNIRAIQLPGRPVWVIPHPAKEGRPGWYVTLDDGTAVTVDPDGLVEPAPPTSDGLAPEVDQRSGCPVLTTAHALQSQFDNPLPDTRVVESGSLLVALVDPTDRYGHGVLGDPIEAAAIAIHDTATGTTTKIEIPAPSVVEGISPLLADIDQDGIDDVLVTLSNDEVGAWLAAYRIDGTLLAESEPIGQGRRWRNQLGVAAVGPGGEVEIIDVRTPHIGGTVEYFRYVDGRLDLVAATERDSSYSTHSIGSRNLDLGLIVAVELGGPLSVVVPTQDRRALVALNRTADGVTESARLDLPAEITTNLAGVDTFFGAYLAVGTADNTLRFVSGCFLDGIPANPQPGGDC